MRSVFVDFETRSNVDIKAQGTYLYACSPTTEVIAVSVRGDNGEILLSWAAYEDSVFPAAEYSKAIAGAKIFAHNVFFEYCVHNYNLANRFDVHFRPDWLDWDCTQAELRTFALPAKLGDGAKALGLPEDKASNLAMLRLSKPRSVFFDEGIVWWPVVKELEDYCNQDTLVSWHIHKRLGDLPGVNRTMHLATNRINLRGLKIDRPFVTNIMRLISREQGQMLRRGLALGVANINSLQQTLGRLKDFGFILPNLQKATVAAALESEDLWPEVREILEIRQALANSSTKKFGAMLARASMADDRVRDLFVYCGAGTGRWSSVGVQLQNLPRGGGGREYSVLREALLKEDFAAALDIAKEWNMSFNSASVCLVRPAFIPEKGKYFVCSDYGQIETRVLYWLAGMQHELDILRKGLCVYKHMAGRIYQLKDAQSMPKDDPRRQVGKVAVLGLGYQMGAERFAKENKLESEFAQKIVDVFRKDEFGELTKIPRLWYTYERALRSTIESGQARQVGPISFSIAGDFAQIRLPSGRKISYYQPKVDDEGRISYMAVDSQKKLFCSTDTYGGKITENIVQAVALDLMAGAVDRLEAYNYPIVLTAHDEGLAEVPNGFGSLEEMNEIMVDVPTWAQAIPLIAEGWEGDHYRK